MAKTHIEEREASERKTEALQRKLQELFSQLKITVPGDFSQPAPASFDILITKSCLISSLNGKPSMRTHIEEREASERKTEALQRKLQELFSQLKITVTGDFAQPTPASFDILITKVS
ncbi:unnamed protein product [Adineta steineri]|uniref:Uncharacterized protein n=1 Tax=Adineta steineri TaxID=433720 RepID=A0A814RH73_9BILA|nr:unnamed protein product [Adineta steineri]